MTEPETQQAPAIKDISDVQDVAMSLYWLFYNAKIEVDLDSIEVRESYAEYNYKFKRLQDLEEITPGLFEYFVKLLGTRNFLIKAPVEGTNNMLRITIVVDPKPQSPTYFEAIISMLKGDLPF